ncbi:MAG: murein L,D-transpeptidase [Cohaesibacteraceae bacterium]
MKLSIGARTGTLAAALLSTTAILAAAPSSAWAQYGSTIAQIDAAPVQAIEQVIETSTHGSTAAANYVRPVFQAEPNVTARELAPLEPVAETTTVPMVDAAAIAARDGRMLATLPRQAIAAMIDAGLDNDGETTSSEREAIEAFYLSREHKPVFTSASAPNGLADVITQLFETADGYGLNPEDYAHGAFLSDGPATAARAAAEADIAMALWTVRYARHAQTGRINPASISDDITLERNFVDPATVLPALIAAGDPAAALLAYHPPHAQFHALREELERLRNQSSDELIVAIDENGTIRLGDRDERVPQLRARLGLPEVADEDLVTASIGTYDGPSESPAARQADKPEEVAEDEAAPEAIDPLIFDEVLDAAVKEFQADHNLTADGIVGPATFAALNEQAGDLTPHIIANMERWRWLPRDLGDFHVLANVPEFRLWVMDEGESIFTTRTVVGQNRHSTAIFSDEMEYMAVNPYWNVPSSIARGELLPRVLQDQSYLTNRNYEVIYNGSVFDPAAVNWEVAAERGLPRIRQRPGSGNALGEIKFMFPNQHAIYFHDTPSRSLFGRDTRTFSHGCVRVQDPWAFAEALLENEPDWDLARLQTLRGPREQNFNLTSHIPVHLTYFTARVADDGRLIMARDIYGHHQRVLDALGLDGA